MKKNKPTTEENNWRNYYSQLTADEIALAVTGNLWFIPATKSILAAAEYQHENAIKIPGAIWRNGSTHRQTDEPTDEEIEKGIDKYIDTMEREGGRESNLTLKIYIKLQRSLIYYNDHKDHIYNLSEPATRYITYHPLILKRIYELTEPLLYGQREDVQQLVKEYQAGNKELLQRIINQLGGIIDKATKQFSFIGNKETFTNLAGKFNKKLPKPETDEEEDQRLMLITEPFIFDVAELKAVINKAVLQALASYDFNQGAQFKTWFYRIIESDLLDLYRQYQRSWKNGKVISTYGEYEAELQQRVSPRLDNTEAADILTPGFMEQLTIQQQQWINLFLKMLPASLQKKLTADILAISEKTEYNRRKALQELITEYRAIYKKYKEVVIVERIKPPKIIKLPPSSKQQKTLIKQYNDFINKPGYRPGICKGSGFFPLNVIITDLIE